MADTNPEPTQVTDTPQGAEAQEPKPEQAVTLEDAGPAMKRLTIELPESRVKEALEEGFGGMMRDAVLPGFRRGRAPRRLIEKRFGESLREDVKNRLISQSYQQAIEENELDPLGEPTLPQGQKIDDIALPESGSMSFTLEVEVTPEFALPELSGLEVKRQQFEVGDEQVEREIEAARQRFGTPHEANEDEVRAEDYVQMDVRLLAGHDADPDAEDTEVLLNQEGAYTIAHGERFEYRGHVAGILIDDLGKQLIGKRVGEEPRINVTGPGGHEEEKVRDQPITLAAKITAIQRIEPAPIETVQQALGVADEGELRERIRTMLGRRAEQQQRQDSHRQIARQLLEKVDMELPQRIAGRQTARVLARRRMELVSQGVDEQQVEQRLAELRADSAGEAARSLKLFFILDRIARELEVDVTEQELNGQISMIAMQQNRRPEKLRQEMIEKNQIEQLYLQIREQKTLDAVLERAEVTDAKPGDEAETPADSAESA